MMFEYHIYLPNPNDFVANALYERYPDSLIFLHKSDLFQVAPIPAWNLSSKVIDIDELKAFVLSLL